MSEELKIIGFDRALEGSDYTRQAIYTINTRIFNDISELDKMKQGDLLSVSVHKVKKHFKINKLTKSWLEWFESYCNTKNLVTALTELQVTELNFTKSYLDEIREIIGENDFRKIKNKATINILPKNTKIKSSSWILIGKE